MHTPDYFYIFHIKIQKHVKYAHLPVRVSVQYLFCNYISLFYKLYTLATQTMLPEVKKGVCAIAERIAKATAAAAKASLMLHPAAAAQGYKKNAEQPSE